MPQLQQFQVNAANQGFAAVTTGPANIFKWKVEIGPVSFASPVIGNDGTVYIGNLLGELVAVSPTGAILWKRTLDQRGSIISASPAIDSNGNIYVVTTYRATVRDHRSGETVTSKVANSKLHSIAPDGSLRWTFPFPVSGIDHVMGGYSLSSPKIWGQQNLIFIPALFTRIASRVEILVIDQAGNLVHRREVADYPTPPVTAGNGIYDLLGSVWDFLNGMEFEPSGGPALNKQFGWPEPSLAIADFGPHSAEPIVIIEDNWKKLAAFRWNSRQQLEPLWEKKSNDIRFRATPSVFLSSMVASGQNDGTLALYDLVTGQELWKPWYKAPSSIQSSATSFVSQIYLISLADLSALDANAKLIKRTSLGMMALGAPGLSVDRVFVNGGDGYYSFSLDLKEVSKNSEFQGGVSSPAIAEDGSVYVIDRNKTLWAFGKETRRKPPRNPYF